MLEGLVEALEVSSVQISAYGLREGLLYDAMPPAVQARDPLMEGCAALGARQDVAESLGAGLTAWLSPAFADLPPVMDNGRDSVMLAAACRLADLGSRLHPDHRAQLTFEQVLRAPVAGMNHAERAFLARAVFARHSASATTPEAPVLDRLLTPERQQRARAIGAAVRLGCDLSGRSTALLERASLSLLEGAVVLRAAPSAADMLLGEQTARRAQTFAATLERELRIESA